LFCAERLAASGFTVSEQPFDYSQFPARWGPPLAGALLATISLVGGHLAIGHDLHIVALLFSLICALNVGVLAGALVRHGPLRLRFSRATSVNLIAMRSREGRRPRIWLAAHLDTKSQTVPMLVRTGAVAAFVLAFAGMIGALIAISLMPQSNSEMQHELMHVAFAFSIVAAVSALPLMFCFIGNKSSGAADNATGVAAVLLAAEMLRDHQELGVLITSAEELALAGARAFVRDVGGGGTALNCDTIDDDGRFICMAKGPRPAALDGAINRAATGLGIETMRPARGPRGPARLRAMLPGVLADNIAFTDAGWDSFTLSRGNLRTLARVHTSRDRADSITGAGIPLAARLLAATSEELS